MIKPRAWLLKLTSGPSKDKLIPLAERLTIGRSAENDLVIADSLLSRNHAVIERAGGGYQVSDLGSGNGTLVNGVLIGKPTRLKPGDVVQIGDTRITVLGPDGTAPLPLDESTQMKPAPAATQVQVRAAARSTQAIPAPVPAARLCPHCGAPLKPTSKFCRNCGKVSAPGVAEAAPLRPPPAAAPALTCPNCGEPVRPGVKFCRKCGTTL